MHLHRWLVESAPTTIEYGHRSLQACRTQLRASVQWTVREVAFWLAVVIPLCYLLLLAGGFAGRHAVVSVGILLPLNVVALTVSHDHRR